MADYTNRQALTLALGGVFQAVRLITDLSTHGLSNASHRDASLRSVLLINADAVADIFPHANEFSPGLKLLLQQLEGPQRDPTTLRYVILLLQLERSLSRSTNHLAKLRTGLETLADHGPLDSIDDDLIGRLSDLYSATISPLSPRIMVHGDARHLRNRLVTNQVRALLLAGLRSAVLWRQLGGRRISLLLNRKKYADTARQLISPSH